jgi:hypothetical protein
MKGKPQFIQATVVLEVKLHIGSDTVPEDVFCDSGLTIDTDHGVIFEKKVIHTAITKQKTIKKK